MKKNNSEGKPYYSQRNNKIKPNTSCMTTSMVNALSAAGWPVERLGANGSQPEDELLRFIMNDPVVDRKWKQLDPAGAYPPNEWHEVLALGTNIFLSKMGLGKDAVRFCLAVGMDEIREIIDSGGSLVVSGRFPIAKGSSLDHAVSVVGYEKNGEDNFFILDDPWGDYRTGYRSTSGNDVQMREEDWTVCIKECGKQIKRAHIIRKYPA